MSVSAGDSDARPIALISIAPVSIATRHLRQQPARWHLAPALGQGNNAFSPQPAESMKS
jgi:hypothetical protein